MSTASPAMNTEFRDAPPDVDSYCGPLKSRCLALVDKLLHRELNVDEYQQQAQRIVTDPATLQELEPLIANALSERKDQVMFRRQDGPRRTTLQLLYVAPHEVHPPHAHHNLISNQMNVSGRCYVREYDRVARIDDRTLLLRLAQDGWFQVGDLMQTTEVYRNAHWFAAAEEPCVVLNFYLLGFQSWTFDPPAASRRKGRQLVDPTLASQEDGLIVAKEVDFQLGYGKFAGRAISDFPAVPARI
jgi:hypothetical protein